MSERDAKTEAGRQEIAHRARRLPAQLRSILLVIDGNKDDNALQQIVAGVHAPEDALAQLQQMGLIRRGGDPVAAPAPAISASSARPPASATTGPTPSTRWRIQPMRGYRTKRRNPILTSTTR